MSLLKLRFRGALKSRNEASGLLESPGDTVLIERGTPQWLLMVCPCGCGEILPINLDRRSGPAWKLYKHPRHGISLFPSVWRETGCESHFIIWRDQISLLGRYDEEADFAVASRDERTADLTETIRKRLPQEGLVSFWDLAESLDAVPWDVLNLCRDLVRTGLANEGTGKRRGCFGRK
jgi:hypothetical protein